MNDPILELIQALERIEQNTLKEGCTHSGCDDGWHSWRCPMRTTIECRAALEKYAETSKDTE